MFNKLLDKLLKVNNIDHTYKLFTKKKIPFLIVFGLTILLLLSQIITILSFRYVTVLVMSILSVILHILLLANSGYCLYYAKDASYLYPFISGMYITAFSVSLIVFLQIYKKYMSDEIKITSNKKTLLEISIIFAFFSIIINILLRDKSIIYVINILLSLVMIIMTIKI